MRQVRCYQSILEKKVIKKVFGSRNNLKWKFIELLIVLWGNSFSPESEIFHAPELNHLMATMANYDLLIAKIL